MDVSIIIINYKSTRLVLDCLDSIYKQTHRHSFEIIIVDNNSKDDCKEKVLATYPSAHWIEMGYNAGFARANNAGMTVAARLLEEPYLSTDVEHEGILLHSIYHQPNGWDYTLPGSKIPYGESSMWGDYHLLELCLLLSRMAQGSYYTFFS